MIGFLHGLTMFVAIILMTLWMVMVTEGILHGKILNTIASIWKPLGIVLCVVAFVFIIRVWYVAAMDVQNIVNYIFSSCEPIDISKFG